MHTSIIVSIIAIAFGIFMINLWLNFDRLVSSHEQIYPIGKRIHQMLSGICIANHRDMSVLLGIIQSQTTVFVELDNVKKLANRLNITQYRAAAILNCAIPRGARYRWVVINGEITMAVNKSLLSTKQNLTTA